MSARITKADVEAKFNRLHTLARLVGIAEEDEGWHLQTGSPSNGRAWRMFRVSDSGSLHSFYWTTDYLGWTAKEAFERLDGIIVGIEATRIAERNRAINAMERISQEGV